MYFCTNIRELIYILVICRIIYVFPWFLWTRTFLPLKCKQDTFISSFKYNQVAESNVRDSRARIVSSVNDRIWGTFGLKFRTFRYGCNPQLKLRGWGHPLRYARSTKQPFQSINPISVYVTPIGIVLRKKHISEALLRPHKCSTSDFWTCSRTSPHTVYEH